MAIFSQCFSVGNGDLTVAVKDSIDIAGFPTRAGSQALADAPSALQHAEVIESVLAAGGQLIGKTTMHELAYGMSGVNHWVGTAENVFFPDLIPGGSSSGSAAAVAKGLADFSLGTDTGGSVRVPAACCGVFGFKPTFGRVSRKGVMPEYSSLDCVGPFATSAEMLITAMTAIDSSFKPFSEASIEHQDRSSVSKKIDKETVRLGVVTVDAEPEVLSTVNGFIQQTGFETQAVSLPGLKAAFDAGMTLINAETWAACGQYLATGQVGEDVAKRLANAENTSAEAIEQAELIRKQFTAEVDAALEHVTVLVMPTLPSIPMALSDALAGQTDLQISAFVRPFNLSGHPALSLPLLSQNCRPVGLQLIGRKGDDERLCELARMMSTDAGSTEQQLANLKNNKMEP